MKMNKGKMIRLTILLLLVLPVAVLTWTALFYHPKEVKGTIRLAKSFRGHKEGVWAVAFSPDSRFLASGSIDSTIIIREVRTGNPVCILKHPAGVTGLAYSKDGKYIVSSSYDGIVRLWSVEDQQLLKAFKGAEGTVWTVAFNANGRYIAGAGDDRIVRVWDITKGTVVHELKGHLLNIWSIKFSPDGRQLASASFDNSIIIWDVKSGKQIRTLKGHTEAVVALAFSPDGKTLASTSDDKTVKLWSAEDGKLLETVEAGDEHVQAVAFSPDGKKLIVGGRDKDMLGELVQNFFGDSYYNKGISMRLWDLSTQKLLQTFSYHANDVNDLAWSCNGKWIASGSADKTVGLWKVVDIALKMHP